MEYKAINNNIELIQPDFDLDETLDCGQAFRWERLPSEYECTYSGFFLDRPLEISQDKGKFIFHNTSEKDFLNIWKDYFDLETDYGKIKGILSQDETLKKACEFAGGIRLLKQNSWECLCSFIISQNNNIPRIKGIIARLCDHYGHFPSAAEMAQETVDSLGYLRSGFRAKYLIDAAQKTASGEIELDKIKEMPIEEARKALMTVKGVGPKVAECVLLFGMHRAEAFPVDVWIKRVMAEYYPGGLPECAAGNEGIAQQYLFHYIRNMEK
ncbi:DNA-3-methyladenine glycosylase family protein [Porcipelethomonas sp.]|uniref:DNA-3-methyladenine glycosylase family protein n=1 Tax=Porcipelethomonas sp. TaxID=2981675 RepID=UPI003EF21565